jgi:hypothetical protein
MSVIQLTIDVDDCQETAAKAHPNRTLFCSYTPLTFLTDVNFFFSFLSGND